MKEYKPQYPILGPEDMSPREEMKLVPEDQLDPFWRAEINNIKRGTAYQYVLTDTPENRRNIALRVIYYQMVAYKEGWKFNPDLYSIDFVPEEETPSPSDGCERRILHYARKCGPVAALFELSPENNLGIKREPDGKSESLMGDEETDDLYGKVLKMFPNRAQDTT